MSTSNTYSHAEICKGGHVVRKSVRPGQEKDDAFCTQCGEAIIETCPSCGNPIKGVSSASEPYKRPNNCHACGKAFPWGEIAIA